MPKLCETIKMTAQDFAPDRELRYLSIMFDDRIENAVQRIEVALSRIAQIADAPVHERAGPDAPSSVIALVEKHETLHETASNTLAQLDKLIEELESE